MWRNSRRTGITVAAVSLNVALLIIIYALMEGFWEHTISNAVNLVVGEAQIHAPKYLVNRSMYAVVEKPDRVLTELREAGIPAVARSYGYGLAAVDKKSSGALFWGVDPVQEKQVFDLAGHVDRGSWLPEAAGGGLVLGKKLARILDVAVGSELVVVIQAADGSLGNELYRVTGILKSASESIDRSAAIMHRVDFKRLFVSGGRIHEIAVNTRGDVPPEQLTRKAESASPGDDVQTWRELLPMLSDMINIFDAGMAIFMSIFFLAGGLGLLNTLLMSTFERIREFGMLKALGATPWRIVRDVAAEALLIGVISSIIGAAAGLASAYLLQAHGLNLTWFAGDLAVSGIAFDPIWKASVYPLTVIKPVLVMCLVCLLASVYPAILAARLDPVQAMTKV
jgi:ABC-type lipoprotein release transport system permease subunit